MYALQIGAIAMIAEGAERRRWEMPSGDHSRTECGRLADRRGRVGSMLLIVVVSCEVTQHVLEMIVMEDDGRRGRAGGRVATRTLPGRRELRP